MRQLQGIPASPGVALGPAFRFERRTLEFPRLTDQPAEAEWTRFETAIAQVREALTQIRDRAEREIGAAEAEIFEAHLMFLDDPALLDAIRSAIEANGLNAEAAVHDATHYYAAILEGLPDPTLSARAVDVHDVGHRLKRALLNIAEDGASLTAPSVVIAHELTPSDTVMMDRRLVLAMITEVGGPTSHAAILARSYGIPAIVGVGGLIDIASATLLAVDGSAGTLVVDPDEATQLAVATRRADQQVHQAQARVRAIEPAISRDGKRVEVVANVGAVSGARIALEQGAEGIGLFRTEFLYIKRETAPDEDEQTEQYRAVIEVMGERPVIVRTLDIGGDKPLPYLDLGHEDNPFLGLRALRIGFEYPDILLAQLRAILRAGAGHCVKVMFPMVATVGEARAARAMLEQARAELIARSAPIAEQVEVGVMIEIPSAALSADRLARVVDFFSIGTNDLAQYALAADRTNARVAHIADAFHPSVLRLIRQVIEASHAAGTWTGLCGELAGEPLAVPILFGLGLDEFSMNPPAIPIAKEIVRGLTLDEARPVALAALDLDDGQAVRALVRATWPWVES
ncbi:MAG TPA: phosphoenolpyruvate--protein phosphotransferase [Anaerolineae bacterium]|nr:phosphoenolpyruvate--protein phosphotransferase [Anaerolineae bacterium]